MPAIKARSIKDANARLKIRFKKDIGKINLSTTRKHTREGWYRADLKKGKSLYF